MHYIALVHRDRWASVEGPPRASLVCSSSQIGSVLSRAEGMILVAESGGEAALDKALPFAPQLRRLVLLSAIGGSKGGARGNFAHVGIFGHLLRQLLFPKIDTWPL